MNIKSKHTDIPWILNIIVNYIIKSRGIQKCHEYFLHILESLDYISKIEILNNAKHISTIDGVMRIVIHRAHGQNKPILIILQENVFKTLTVSPNSMIGTTEFLHRCIMDGNYTFDTPKLFKINFYILT